MLFSCWYGDICTSLKISFHCRSHIRVGRVVNALESDLSTYLCKFCVFLSRPAASCCSSPNCVCGSVFLCLFLPLNQSLINMPWLNQKHYYCTPLLLILQLNAHSTFISFSLLLISNQHTLLCDLVLEQTCHCGLFLVLLYKLRKVWSLIVSTGLFSLLAAQMPINNFMMQCKRV